MKKAYFLVPLIGVLIFSFFYWNARKDLVEKELAEKRHREELRLKKIQDEVAARQKAYEDAIVQAERRKKEKAEREAKEQAERDAREALLAEREKSFREQEKLARNIERLTKDVTAEKEEIQKVEGQKNSYQSEQEFLKSYVKQAETNQKGLEDVLNKIAAAEKAIQDAAAKAAQAKAKS
jgi:colicin import membrane protein